MVTITLYVRQQKRHRCIGRLLDSVGEGEGGMIWENGIETCILSYVKQIASPGSMHDTGCLGLVHWDTQRDGMGREVGEAFRMRNTCKKKKKNVSLKTHCNLTLDRYILFLIYVLTNFQFIL